MERWIDIFVSIDYARRECVKVTHQLQSSQTVKLGAIAVVTQTTDVDLLAIIVKDIVDEDGFDLVVGRLKSRTRIDEAVEGRRVDEAMKKV